MFYKNLIYIAYDNHIYPLKNTVLNRVKLLPKEEYNLIIETDLNNKILEHLNNGILPGHIYIKGDKITRFCVGNDKYLDNDEYIISNKVLDTLGLSDKSHDMINLTSISSILEKLYIPITDKIGSFMPHADEFVKGGFTYNNDNDSGLEKTTIDKNKCYTYVLSKLQSLISVDMRTAEIFYDVDKNKLCDSYLYLACPSKSSILLDNKNLYTGYHLKYCIAENLDFTIEEGIKTRIHNNYYKSMIHDLYNKIDSKTCKHIINRLIGKFENNTKFYTTEKFVKICNKKESKGHTGYINKLSKDFYVCSTTGEQCNLYNKKPISIQIKDESRRIIYETLKSMKIHQDDIIQIKTDSITFQGGYKYKHLINNRIDGWKVEEYKKINTNGIDLYNCSLSLPKNINENKIGIQYAGGGKTYNIINNIVPLLTDYIVLAPSHSALIPYHKNNINCSTIQYFTCEMIKSIPDEQTIIIDEIGMVNSEGWDLIYECYLKRKTLYAYGDFNQLPPVSPYGHFGFSSINFIHHIFNNIDNTWKNWRNKFTKEYYDSLINNELSLQVEVNKHSSKEFYKASTIICYTNNIRDKYNNLMCKKLGINSKFQKDAILILRTNNLKELDIYNKSCFKVIDIDGYIIKMINLDNDKIVDIPREKIEKNFEYGYCKTIYSLQGSTIDSYYWCKEDDNFLSSNTAYTIISRLSSK